MNLGHGRIVAVCQRDSIAKRASLRQLFGGLRGGHVDTASHIGQQTDDRASPGRRNHKRWFPSCFHSSLALMAVIGAAVSSTSAHAHKNSVDDSLLMIHSVAHVQAKREALTRFVWGTDWSHVLSLQPTATRSNYMPVPDDALPDTNAFANFALIEQIVTTMKVPNAAGDLIRHTSTAFFFHPHVSNGHVVILHHGHGCSFNGSDDHYNLNITIRQLSDAGFGVVAMRMPLFQRPSECGQDAASGSHDEMFTDPAQRLQTGSPVQFFLEPVARVLNYIQRTYPVYNEFDMIGLSGGGWTTTIYSAIDPRITLSFPVAGSIPLYLRGNGMGGSYPDDREQYDALFYGIAGYKDLYVLGSYGTGRRQTQILNRYDDCCFGEAQHHTTPAYLQAVRAYACDVQSTLWRLGAGAFTVDVDESAHTHQIPLAALSGVILPTLQSGSAGPSAGSCMFPAAEAVMLLKWPGW